MVVSVEVESDYQKSSWLKVYLVQGHETNLGFLGLQNTPKIVLGPSRESRDMLPWESLKMEPPRLANNAFPAYSYGHEVS